MRAFGRRGDRSGVVSRDVSPFSGWTRALIYLLASIGVTIIAFGLGAAHSDSANCRDAAAGDCDLSGLEGLVWAASVLALIVVAVVVLEVRLFRARRRGHHTEDG